MRPLPLWMICSLLLFPLSATSAQTTATPTPAPAPVFGVVEGYYQPEKTAKLGATWERIIFPWNAIQPRSPSGFDTTAIPDNALDSAARAGREVVGLIKGTPQWASKSGSLGAVPDGLDLSVDDPGNTFAVFMRRLVSFYAPRGVHTWIIGNEPDIRPGEGTVEFEGSEQDYAKLLRAAYLVARSVDPDAKILVAGTTWWYDFNQHRQPYLFRLLRAIATDPKHLDHHWYFDGIALHIYFTTSSVWQIIDANRSILTQFGLADKSIWLNEFNASPRTDPEAAVDAPFHVSLDQQADFIVQASAEALAAGVERLAVYRMYDDHFIVGTSEPWGLVRADGSLRPAYFAYRQVIEKFSGYRRIERQWIPEATLITLVFPDHALYVMWSNTFDGGEFLLHGGRDEDAIAVADATGEAAITQETLENKVPLLVVEAPGAIRIDSPWPVVAGSVRVVALDGPPRTVWYRTGDHQRVAQLR